MLNSLVKVSQGRFGGDIVHTCDPDRGRAHAETHELRPNEPPHRSIPNENGHRAIPNPVSASRPSPLYLDGGVGPKCAHVSSCLDTRDHFLLSTEYGTCAVTDLLNIRVLQSSGVYFVAQRLSSVSS